MSESQISRMADDRISQPYAVVLLPSPPSSSFQRLRQAYGPGLSSVLSKMAKSLNGANRIAVLDVAVVIPGVLSPSRLPRAKVFSNLQHLLASLYTLVGAICAAEKIELDGPGGIDVRIFFVDDEPTRQPAKDGDAPGVSVLGPIIDLWTLTTCGRPWDAAYTLDSKQGEELTAAFSSRFRSGAGVDQLPRIYTVPAGEIWTTASDQLVITADTQSGPHYSVAVGGTFDHLHIGHKLLLTATALAIEPPLGERQDKERLMTIGVTGDELLVNKKYAQFLESWDDRWQSAASFLNSIIDFSPPEKHPPQVERAWNPEPNGTYALTRVSPDLSLRFVQISDPFGPTITDEGITALVLSKETRSGGKAVNDERAKKGWSTLEVFEVDILQTGEVAETESSNVESFESKISSTDIRRRRMDMARGNL